MELLALFVVVMTTCVYQTGALSCADCVYLELPEELDSAADAFAHFTDGKKCQTGGTTVDTDPCNEAGSGEKDVCIAAKGTIGLKITIGGSSVDADLTLYSRGCEGIDSEDYPEDTGTLAISSFRTDINKLISDLNGQVSTIGLEVKTLSGGVEYCSSNNCQQTNNISNLKGGVATTLPSMLLVAMLALLAAFYTI